jgi:ketosteroid isomerase-like protein
MGKNPLETTKFMYNAFAHGDIPALMECLSPNIAWEYGVISHDVPWYQARQGLTGVGEFFASLQAIEFHKFEPTVFLQEGNTVVVLLNADYTVKATGLRVVYEDAVMLWKFDASGQVTQFAHRVDTHQAWLAHHGRAGA